MKIMLSLALAAMSMSVVCAESTAQVVAQEVDAAVLATEEVVEQVVDTAQQAVKDAEAAVAALVTDEGAQVAQAMRFSAQQKAFVANCVVAGLGVAAIVYLLYTVYNLNAEVSAVHAEVHALQDRLNQTVTAEDLEAVVARLNARMALNDLNPLDGEQRLDAPLLGYALLPEPAAPASPAAPHSPEAPESPAVEVRA